MINQVQPGKILTLTAPYAVASGAGALVGTTFGVATSTLGNGEVGEFAVEGVFELAKETSNAAVAGMPAYWDNAARNITAVPVAANGPAIGVFTSAALAADAIARVKLNGIGRGNGLRVAVSTELTGTGSAQNFAHGLGVVPSAVVVVPTDTTPATTGAFTVTEGTHTSTNAVITVTTSKKFKVLVFA